MNILKKIDDYVSVFTEWLLGTSIILMAVVLISNVIARKVFSNSIPAARRNRRDPGHTRQPSVGSAMRPRRDAISACRHCSTPVPLKVQKILIILISSVTCATYVYVCFIAFEYIEYTKMLGRVTSALEMPALDPGGGGSHRLRTGGYPICAEHRHEHQGEPSLYRHGENGHGGKQWYLVYWRLWWYCCCSGSR